MYVRFCNFFYVFFAVRYNRHISRLKYPCFAISVDQIAYPKDDLSVTTVDLSFEFTALSLTEYLIWLQ